MMDSWEKKLRLENLDKQYGLAQEKQQVKNETEELTPENYRREQNIIVSNSGLDSWEKKLKLGQLDKKYGMNSQKYPDYSKQLNDTIKKCILEFNPKDSFFDNLGKWNRGVFNQWDFVADTWWSDKPDSKYPNTVYKSYIPKDVQESIKDKYNDYFVVNGHVMNREQYGNYVKGATAAFIGVPSPLFINIAGTGHSLVDSLDPQKGYHFSWSNETEDSKYTDLGYFDMIDGKITGNAGYYDIAEEIYGKGKD